MPAFSGLYAPRWHPEARGVMVGLTSYITRGHLARAVLEATGWQTREVVDAMNADSGLPVTRLKVDGGMTANHLLMQFVADVLDVPVERPLGSEAVSLGAAYAAGLAVGYWSDLEVLRGNWHRAAAWEPAMDAGGAPPRARELGPRGRPQLRLGPRPHPRVAPQVGTGRRANVRRERASRYELPANVTKVAAGRATPNVTFAGHSVPTRATPRLTAEAMVIRSRSGRAVGRQVQ